MGAIVGLVVNPSASRDIRRLTSLARTVDVHERVNQVARILQGLSTAAELVPGGVTSVRYMPESCRVVERAGEEVAHAGLARARANAHPAARGDPKAGGRGPSLAVDPVGSPDHPCDDAAGTTRAAAAMARSGARCVVTVGGDGTNRAVARGWPDAVICAVPGGTNNAFAPAVDPGAAGLAAGIFAAGPSAVDHHARAMPRLMVRPGSGGDHGTFEPAFALVDVAVVRGAWIGAHAVWDPAALVDAVVARIDPTVSGLAGLAGMARPAGANRPGSEPRAVHLGLGEESDADGVISGGPSVHAFRDADAGRDPDAGRDAGFRTGVRTVLAPLGPGQLVAVSVRSWCEVGIDETIRLGPFADRVTLAFDGERETVVEPGITIEVRLVRSPLRLLDAAGLLRELSEKGALALPA